MRNLVRLAGLAVLLVLVGSCSTVSYVVDRDERADFSSYSSFAWFELAEGPRRGAPPVPANTLIEERIRRAVTAELAGMGLAAAAVGEADLLVTFHVALRERLSVQHLGWGHPYRGCCGWGPGFGWGGGATAVRSHTEGSLVVDVIDARRRQLVWRGVADGALQRPNASDEEIARVVSRLLAEFPGR